MSTEVREGLCYRRNPASQRTGKWKSHASGYSFFLACQPKMGIGSRLYASADPSDDARCIWQICPFRCGPPYDLVALREFWKSEKPSIRGTCSNMSMLHDYMVLRSRENARGKRRITLYIVYFMDHMNSEDTIFAVNTGDKMVYAARWVSEIG